MKRHHRGSHIVKQETPPDATRQTATLPRDEKNAYRRTNHAPPYPMNDDDGGDTDKTDDHANHNTNETA